MMELLLPLPFFYYIKRHHNNAGHYFSAVKYRIYWLLSWLRRATDCAATLPRRNAILSDYLYDTWGNQKFCKTPLQSGQQSDMISAPMRKNDAASTLRNVAQYLLYTSLTIILPHTTPLEVSYTAVPY